MGNYKNLNCSGQITNTGALGIIDKGFCYSKSNGYPTLLDSVWSVTAPLDFNNAFHDVITGLTEATYYYVNAYAINSMGTSYSAIGTTAYVKTSGISNFPTITVSIINNGIPQTLFEMGTSSLLTVTGVTTKNDEIIFNGGELKQISSPPPPGTNTILTWPSYSGPPPPTHEYIATGVTFSPIATDTQSWNMTQTAYDYCGSPQYTITGTTTISSVFPYLWVLKSSYQNSLYFNPHVVTTGYFYYEANSAQSTLPTTGKLIDTKNSETFMMAPYNASHKFLSLGYPASYGDVQYSVDNINWWTPSPSNLITMSVSTGTYGDQFGIVNSWKYNYKILQVEAATTQSTPPTPPVLIMSSIPQPFYIKFV